MALLYEPVDFEEVGDEKLRRVVLLATGAGLGVLTSAFWLHGYETGEWGKGKTVGVATRTAIHAIGATAGTLVSEGMIRLVEERKPPQVVEGV